MTATLERTSRATVASESTADRPWRVLFVKDRFAWPRASGHDIHTYYLLEAMQRQGHRVSLACFDRPDRRAVECVYDRDLYVLGDGVVPVPTAEGTPITFTKMQRKFQSYWGISEERIRWVEAVARHVDADAVAVVGLGCLPLLGSCQKRVCIWYAADEWVWHHLSQVRPFRPSTWAEIKPAIVKGIYERVYRPILDRTWVVSEADQSAFRWLAGIRKTDLVHNGVDATYYCPAEVEERPRSCVFWGRLDFGPNIQAVDWFCGNVWPLVRARLPDATFSILGFAPTDPVRAWHGKDGITVTANVPDVRPPVRESAVVVMPFVSGGGVKNKLLEAAAMGKAIVGTSRVTNGLRGQLPLATGDSPNAMAGEIVRLATDDRARRELGLAARDWVRTHQTWDASATVAIAGIRQAMREKAKS